MIGLLLSVILFAQSDCESSGLCAYLPHHMVVVESGQSLGMKIHRQADCNECVAYQYNWEIATAEFGGVSLAGSQVNDDMVRFEAPRAGLYVLRAQVCWLYDDGREPGCSGWADSMQNAETEPHGFVVLIQVAPPSGGGIS